VIPVVADADTLFGATTRGLLIHLDPRYHDVPTVKVCALAGRALAPCGRLPTHCRSTGSSMRRREADVGLTGFGA